MVRRARATAASPSPAGEAGGERPGPAGQPRLGMWESPVSTPGWDLHHDRGLGAVVIEPRSGCRGPDAAATRSQAARMLSCRRPRSLLRQEAAAPQPCSQCQCVRSRAGLRTPITGASACGCPRCRHSSRPLRVGREARSTRPRPPGGNSPSVTAVASAARLTPGGAPVGRRHAGPVAPGTGRSDASMPAAGLTSPQRHAPEPRPGRPSAGRRVHPGPGGDLDIPADQGGQAAALGQGHDRDQARARHQIRVIKRCACSRRAMRQSHLTGVLSARNVEASVTSHRPSSGGTFRVDAPGESLFTRWIEAKQRRRNN